MPSSLAPIEMYQNLSVLSGKMVEAARIQDWDGLVELKEAFTSLRDILIVQDASQDKHPSPVKDALLKQILDDTAEVTRHVTPRMEVLRQLIGDSVHRREIQKTYEGV